MFRMQFGLILNVIQPRACCWPVCLFFLAMLCLGSTEQVGGAPAIFGVTNTVAIESSPVWITAGVTDVVALASVTLAYNTNATPILTNTVFLETMGTNLNGVSPWTGTGCDNAWIVNYNGSNPFSQVTNSNYGGNPCVLQFAKGTTSLVDSMITNASSINATTEKVPATKEPMAAIASAGPARPRCVIA